VSVPEARRWALAYATLGWRVFPVVPGEKRPMYRGWQADATTDQDLIRRWWRRNPAPNIGIVTGAAFVAFDVEAEHLDALRSWMRREGHRLPDTPIARTGGGGVHILARAPSIEGGRDLRLEGVHVGELKARGGFVVACPSVTTSAYAWLVSPLDIAVAEPPGWLLGLATPNAATRSAGPDREALTPSRAVAIAHGLYRVVAEAREGERNSALFWAACRAAEHGLEPGAIAEILGAAAARVGLPEREARATIASGLLR